MILSIIDQNLQYQKMVVTWENCCSRYRYHRFFHQLVRPVTFGLSGPARAHARGTLHRLVMVEAQRGQQVDRLLVVLAGGLVLLGGTGWLCLV